MGLSVLFLLVVAALLGALVARRAPHRIGEALRYARDQGVPIALRIPLALLSAMWLAVLIPPETVSGWIGGGTGVTGILIATVIGGLLPAGPMVTFPLALIVWTMGAGIPQMVALLTSWGIFGIHRTLSFEIPMMGGRFVWLKLAACAVLPPLAGLLTVAVLALPFAPGGL